jgi:hypothetical protein
MDSSQANPDAAKTLTLNSRVTMVDGQPTTVHYKALIEEVLVYEFYIPNTMLGENQTQEFLKNMINLPGGATIFSNMTGTWHGQIEPVTIYRIMIRVQKFGEEATSFIADEVGRLMSRLTKTAAAQEEILFTVSRCNAYSVKQIP